MNRLAFLETLAKNFDRNLSELKTTTTFEDLGMDSYAVVDFVLKVEEKYDIVIPDDRIFSLKNMQDVLDMIDQCKQEEEKC